MDKGALEDKFVYAEVKKLLEKFEVAEIVETGTCWGWSARKFAEFLLPVTTIEVNETFYSSAKEALASISNITIVHGSSPQAIKEKFTNVQQPKTILFFLDAHWPSYWPLQDELATIADLKHIKPIILIHDFFVPDENGNAKFGYHPWDGTQMVGGDPILNHEYVRVAMEKIYNNGGYEHYCIQEAEVNAGVGVYIPKC